MLKGPVPSAPPALETGAFIGFFSQVTDSLRNRTSQLSQGNFPIFET